MGTKTFKVNNTMKNIKILKIHSKAKISYPSKNSAGYDLYALYDFIIPRAIFNPDMRVDLDDYIDTDMYKYNINPKRIIPGIMKLPLGIKSEFSEDYVALLWDRSSLGEKGITVLGGVIDATYRGEWAVILANVSNKDYTGKAGDKIVQVLFQKIERPELIFVTKEDELTITNRGQGGFGSTDEKIIIQENII